MLSAQNHTLTSENIRNRLFGYEKKITGYWICKNNWLINRLTGYGVTALAPRHTPYFAFQSGDNNITMDIHTWKSACNNIWNQILSNLQLVCSSIGAGVVIHPPGSCDNQWVIILHKNLINEVSHLNNCWFYKLFKYLWCLIVCVCAIETIPPLALTILYSLPCKKISKFTCWCQIGGSVINLLVQLINITSPYKQL